MSPEKLCVVHLRTFRCPMLHTIDKTHSQCVSNNTPNFGAESPEVPEKWKRNGTCSRADAAIAMTCAKRIASAPLTAYQLNVMHSAFLERLNALLYRGMHSGKRACMHDREKGYLCAHVQIYPSSECVKRLANGSQTTHQISAQSVQLFLRHEKMPCSRLCPTNDSLTMRSYIVPTWSLNTHQIWFQPVKPFPS